MREARRKRIQARSKVCVCCGVEDSWARHTHYKICSACQFIYGRASSKAHILLAKAIACGVMQEAKKFSCVDCGEKAFGWEHRSYEPGKELDVEPCCRSCNAKRGGADLGWIRAIRLAEIAAQDAP